MCFGTSTIFASSLAADSMKTAITKLPKKTEK